MRQLALVLTPPILTVQPSGRATAGAGLIRLASRADVFLILIALGILGNNFIVDLELSAAQAETQANIISSPRVITANQKEATIEQGVEIPPSTLLHLDRGPRVGGDAGHVGVREVVAHAGQMREDVAVPGDTGAVAINRPQTRGSISAWATTDLKRSRSAGHQVRSIASCTLRSTTATV